jgi:hypothetical protein
VALGDELVGGGGEEGAVAPYPFTRH